MWSGPGWGGRLRQGTLDSLDKCGPQLTFVARRPVRHCRSLLTLVPTLCALAQHANGYPIVLQTYLLVLFSLVLSNSLRLHLEVYHLVSCASLKRDVTCHSLHRHLS